MMQALAMDTMDWLAEVEGVVIRPEDAAYDQARLAWNRKVEQKPALIVDALTAQDVAAAVRHARQQGLGVAVQGTGHGNVRPADECVLILTRGMDQVAIDPAAATATVAAGVKWGAVLAAAQQHGLAPLLGSSPTVGVVGYTLGGGLGWLGRKYGFAADHVLAFEVVTADGELRRAAADENPDLFWGLRGGGGSLGIVTSLTFRLFPVTEVYAGNLYYPVEMAAAVFARYRDWAAHAPDELTSSVLIMNFPPVPALPDVLRGKSFVIVRGCYCGDVAAGEKLLATWREWQTPLIDAFHAIPFSQAATISNDPVDPMPAYNTGAWLHRLSDDAIAAIVAHAVPQGGPSPLVFAEVRHAGGAIRRVPADATAIGNRDGEFVLNVVGVTPTPEVEAHVEAHAESLKNALRPALTGGVYMNFLEGHESRARIADGLSAGGYDRLAQIKARLDGENVLRYSFAVTPRG